MVFLNKKDSLALAHEVGISDPEALSWPDLQKAIAPYLKSEQTAEPQIEGQEPSAPVVVHKTEKDVKSEVPKQNMNTKKVLTRADQGEIDMQPYIGKAVMMAPELTPERYRLVKYDEDLGSEIELEERKFDMDESDRVFDVSGGDIGFENSAHGSNIDTYMDYTTGTYRIKGRSQRRVTAMASVPKENYGLGIRPGIDMFPVVTWQGKAGYLWTHPKYPNVKATLIECGYYQEYKDQFKDQPNIWYAAGKTLAVDINLVHAIFHEIEKKEQKRIQEEKAHRARLGLE